MSNYPDHAYRHNSGYSSGRPEDKPLPLPDPIAAQTSAVVSSLLEGGLEQIIRKQVEQLLASQPQNSNSDHGRGLVGVDKLENFDPDLPHSNIDRWILRFEELGERYGWSDFEKMYLLKGKLLGRAKEWYYCIDTKFPNLMWQDWKKELWKAFMSNDFALDLEELVARRKFPDEPFSHYFQEKIALCERCGIGGIKAVSCLIRGLPEDMRVDFTPLSFQSPEALLSELLQIDAHHETRGRFGLDVDDRERLSQDVDDREVEVGRYNTPLVEDLGKFDRGRFSPPDYGKKRRTSESGYFENEEERERERDGDRRERDRSRFEKNESKPPPRKKLCFNCFEMTTHLGRDCPKPKVLRCISCGQVGHMKADCKERNVKNNKKLFG